jgi:hypothetical protein
VPEILIRQFTRGRMSADVGDAMLDFRLGSGLGLSGKREDSCLLPFTKPRQQHDLASGKLERVMMDVKRARDCFEYLETLLAP